MEETSPSLWRVKYSLKPMSIKSDGTLKIKLIPMKKAIFEDLTPVITKLYIPWRNLRSVRRIDLTLIRCP